MLAAERKKLVQQMLSLNEWVSINALSAKFSVSEETIRRDLEQISKLDPSIVRVHGGAYKIGVRDREAPLSLRKTLSVAQKQRIAQLCYPLIKANDTVMMDCSTTALYAARLIKQNGLGVTIITNSLGIAEEFAQSDQVRLICVGGVLRKNTQSLIGGVATKNLGCLNADKCVVSCTGISMEFGITDNNQDEAEVRALMIRNSREPYLVADERKFGKSFVSRFVDFSELTAIITEKYPSEEWQRFLSARGVSLICPQ
ncbi:MAG: DeoR/GlpR family DNA-binding transcription regulator [Bacillota bacterium]